MGKVDTIYAASVFEATIKKNFPINWNIYKAKKHKPNIRLPRNYFKNPSPTISKILQKLE